MASTTRTSTAADVRAWATSEGKTEGFGSRGRFAPALIKEFNRAHRAAPYAEGNGRTEAVKVPAVTNGRKVTKTVHVPVTETRAWARANGVKVSDKGRIPQEVKVQHALSLLG